VSAGGGKWWALKAVGASGEWWMPEASGEHESRVEPSGDCRSHQTQQFSVTATPII